MNNSPTKYSLLKYSNLVELAGFEPASRYGNHIPSTCLDNY